MWLSLIESGVGSPPDIIDKWTPEQLVVIVDAILDRQAITEALNNNTNCDLSVDEFLQFAGVG